MQSPCDMLLNAASSCVLAACRCRAYRPAAQIYATTIALTDRPAASTSQARLWPAIPGPPGLGAAMKVHQLSPGLSSPVQWGPAATSTRDRAPIGTERKPDEWKY